MDIGYHKFYAGKLRTLLCFLTFIAFVCIGIWMIKDPSSSDKDIFWGYASVVFFGCGSVATLSILFSREPFVIITPEYIKFRSWDKLYWRDITDIGEIETRRQTFLAFEVQNSNRYKLTFGQKIDKMFGITPFSISLNILSKEDQEKLNQIIQQVKKSIPPKQC